MTRIEQGLCSVTLRALPVVCEFVRGDDPDALRRDAATLRRWIDEDGRS